ncbi:hypothetical protein HB830_02485 [Listeria innocua]|uniref:DUF6531 domain-containing protein n=1 Tax=Listeria innocua TaxID=1642 RepID=UPI00162A52BE|nr:DUF6531 domain-containing protein [Listeria innocua]MBC1392252.1 hypothetical protein [Listeria innocua]
MKRLKNICKRTKKVLFIGLALVLIVSGIQLGSVTTFAASVATSGPYADVDVTTQNNETPEAVENAPDNRVEEPAITPTESEHTLPAGFNNDIVVPQPYQNLLDAGYKEVETLRTLDSKTFEKGEAQETFVFMDPIHYEDEDGKLVDYDLNLEAQNNGLLRAFSGAPTVYSPTASDIDLEIPATLNPEHPVTMTYNDVTTSMAPIETFTDPKINDQKAIFAPTGCSKTDGEEVLLGCADSEEHQTMVVALESGIQFNELFQTAIPEILEYQYSVDEGIKLQTSGDKTKVDIVQISDNTILGTIYTPKAMDANNNPYVVETTIEALPTANKNVYTLRSNLKASQEQTPAYPVNIATTDSKIHQGNVVAYGINSADPHTTYGINGSNEEMLMVGYNNDPRYYTTGLFKGIINTPGTNIQSLLGNNREVIEAKMNIMEYTASGTSFTSDDLTFRIYRIEDAYWGQPYDMNWNSVITDGKVNTYANDAKTLNKVYNQFVPFDITEAVSSWYSGAPNYGLLLEADRNDAGLLFANHSGTNAYNANWGYNIQPYITIQHKNKQPVPSDLALDKTTITLRPFTSSEQGGVIKYQALGFDGIARPGSIVDIEVVEANNPTKVVYSSAAAALTGYRQYPYYEPPTYPAIDKAQKYYGLSSNWQSATLLTADKIKADTLYQVRVKAKILHTDGTIKEESAWINGDTFQTYTVKGFDHLPRILNYYGINTNDRRVQMLQDNHMRDELVVEHNYLFIRNPQKNKGKAYISAPLSEQDKKNIDGYLMGQDKHCEYGYEPINLNTGNFYYTNQDASFFDFDDQMPLIRSYNSMAQGVEGIFGRNWDFNWNKRISFLANGDVYYFDGSGKRILFTKTGTNTYTAQNGDSLALSRIQTGTIPYTEDSGYYDTVDESAKTTTIDIPQYQYTITEKNGVIYTFDVNGYVTKAKMDRYEHYMTFDYNEFGLLQKITTPSNKVVSFSYNEAGYVNQVTLPDNNTLTYEYDKNGNLTAFIDQEGYKLQYKYNDTKNPYLMTSYLSRMSSNPTLITNEYDAKGRVLKQTDAENRVVTFEYQTNATIATNYDGKQEIVYFDDQKRTTEKVNLDGTSKVQSYDANNNMTSIDTPSEEAVTYTYDAKGNNTSEVRRDGKIKTYVYNAQNMPIEITNFAGVVTKFTYDSYDNMTSVRYSDGASMSWTYNSDGQMLSETDKNGNTTTHSYQNGNKVSESNPLGSSQITYDANSMVQSETDALGNTKHYNRNKRGELISYVRPNGTQQFTYDADGQKIWESDANGNAKSYTYDGIGRILSETDSYGTKTYGYDVNGNIISEINELGETTQFAYDTANRLIKTIFADGSTTQNVYDPAGHLITTIDQLGFETQYEYDSILNQKIKETAPNGAVTSYSYDTLGNLLQTTFPDGSTETNVYNSLNQLIEKTDKNGTKTTYRYDYNGNTLEINTNNRISKTGIGVMDTQVSETDSLGFETKRTYNAAQLVETTTMRNGATQIYQYDGEYNIIATIDGAGNTVKKEYDGNGNIIKEIDQLGNATTFTYTARNQLATTTYADGGIVQNQYDAKGQQIATIDQLGNKIESIYNNVGRIEKSIDARGFETINKYDAKGQLLKSQDALNQITAYEYDAVGNQIKVTAPTGIITYNTYNQLGQLIESNDNFQRFTRYTYDVLGNMIESTNWKGETTSSTYNEFNEKIATTDMRGNVTTYSYDSEGQMLSEQDAKGNEKSITYNGIGQTLKNVGVSCLPCGATNEENTSYTYDMLGNPVTTTDQDGNETTFKYDAKGQVLEIKNPLGDSIKTTYTSTGLEATTTDANGGIVKNAFDLKGQLIQVIDPEGNKTQYQYDAGGNQILAIDPLGFAVETEYDALNRPIKTIDKNGNSTKTEYNVWNQVARLDAPNNVSQRYEYNDKGQLIKTWDGNGNITTNTYNDFDQLVESKQPNGFIETTIYNEYSDVVEVKNNAGGVRSTNTSSTNNSDSLNNDSRVTSERNTFDQFGQLISKIDANKNETQYEYNSKGQIIKTRAANGNEISYVYDDNGRVASMTDIRGNQTAYLYDALGQVLAVKGANEKTFTYTYDANGNLLSETDPLAAITSYTYNKNNQMTQTTNALGQTQTTTHDARGAVTSKLDAKGNTTKYAYDANGNKTIELDASGNQTAYNYDENNRMTTVRDRRGAETAYAYDQNSNLIKTTNANGAETKFGYDNMNNQTKVTTADHKVQTYSYDLKGNQTSQKNQDGRIITYKYDALNNQVFKGFDDKQYQYTYNSENQITSVVDKESKATLEYNQYGDLISYTDQNQNMVQYDYDSIGRRIGLTYSDGTQTKYEYDLNDHLVKVSNGNDITTYSYDALGNLLETTLPNGSTTAYTYDANNQIEQLKTISKNGTVLSNIEYAYDERGNISTEQSTFDDSTTLKTYTYNEEEQLLSSTHEIWNHPTDADSQQVIHPKGTSSQPSNKSVVGAKPTDVSKEYSYLYDQVGNKLAVIETIAGIVTNKQYKFDNKNALTEEKGGLGVDYSYDATGNVSQKRYVNGVVENFKYDAEGMLLSIQSTTGKTITYTYDGFGNRTQKTEKTEVPESANAGFLSFLKADDTYNEDYNQELVSQTTNEQLGNLRQTISDHLDTYGQTCPVTDEDEAKSSLETINYVNDINREFTEVLQTTNATGNTIHTYTYGVQRINDKKQGEKTTYYAYDARGSVIGKQTQMKPEQLSFKVTYDDFGKPNIKMDNQFGYNAESHDYNSSQYLRARYYDTKSGIFGQQDTYLGDTESPASQNRYAYTMNNPINASDPSGHRPLFDGDDNNTRISQSVQDIIYYGSKNGKNISWQDAEDSYWSRNNGKGNTGTSKDTYTTYIEAQERATREYNKRVAEETRQELRAQTDAHGLKLGSDYDNMTIDEQIAYLRQLIKLCEAMDNEKLNLNEAQAAANALLPKMPKLPVTSTDVLAAPIVFAGVESMAAGGVYFLPGIGLIIFVGINSGMLLYKLFPITKDLTIYSKATTTNQLQKQVERGQAPSSVDRVDKGGGYGVDESQDHIHLKGQKPTLNRDGTWGHLSEGENPPKLPNEVKDWLEKNGWGVPE